MSDHPSWKRPAPQIERELRETQRKMLTAHSVAELNTLKRRARALSLELALTVGTLALGAL